jgi:tRNA (mo5U34)-methyltransferase
VLPARELSPEDIRERVQSLGQWFHNLDLRGVKTAPNHFFGDFPTCKWASVAGALPSDLRGLHVLDIGCNAGFYSIELKRRGAERVLGIDTDEGCLAQARLAAEVCGVDIELEQLSVYEVARLEERFDLVFFMGMIYQLRHPLLALDLIHEHVARDLLVCQSLLRGCSESMIPQSNYPFAETEVFADSRFPSLHFIEHEYAGDPRNWWIPNPSALEGMLRSSGFAILTRPEPEIFICQRQDPQNALPMLESETATLKGVRP